MPFHDSLWHIVVTFNPSNEVTLPGVWLEWSETQNKIHGILRLSNHPNLTRVVLPDLLFDERKFYFALHYGKLKITQKVKPVYKNNCAPSAYPAVY